VFVLLQVSGPKAKVFYLDYGNSETVAVSNLKELREELRTLPAQALLCGLHGVVSTSGKWSDEAAVSFEDLLFEDEYVATVMAKDQASK
jgi:tudor domain-containing protein 1/4/6/7